MKLFSKIRGMLVERQPIFSPNGKEFYYKGQWHKVPRPRVEFRDRYGGYWYRGERVPVPAGGAVDMIQGNSRWHCDFLGPTGTNDTFFMGTRGGVAYTVASGATFGIQGINGGVGRAALGGDDADVVSVFGPLAYEPDEAGRIWMQARLRITDVSVASVFIGFTDDITDTVIIEDEAGTLNTVPADAFGILLEGEQDETYQTVGVGNGSDDTQAAFTNQLADVTDNEWHTVHIEADNQGNAAETVVRYRVRLDGLILETSATDAEGWTVSNARSSIVYAPVVSGDDRNTAYNVDIVEMAADGGVGSAVD